jgi:hypothetical protein
VGCRAEELEGAVLGVCEPDVAGAVVLLHIIQAGEVAAEEVADQPSSLICRGIEENHLRCVGQIAFVAPEDVQYLSAQLISDRRRSNQQN